MHTRRYIGISTAAVLFSIVGCAQQSPTPVTASSIHSYPLTKTEPDRRSEEAHDHALDEHERPVIAPAPDDVPSLLVTTAPAHRSRVRCEAWQVVNAAELAAMLAEHEVDALVNPGAATSTRLLASTIADAAGHPAR